MSTDYKELYSQTLQENIKLQSEISNLKNKERDIKKLSEQLIDDADKDKWIYESPDGGKTIYRRKFGDYDSPREQVIDNRSSEPISKSRAEERLQYLKGQLANEGHLDGWTIKGFKEEIEWIENQLNDK